MTHTVPTTTTYLVQCTNSEIHSNDNMCGGGEGSFPIFSFEAPTTPGGTVGGYTYDMINSNYNNYSQTPQPVRQRQNLQLPLIIRLQMLQLPLIIRLQILQPLLFSQLQIFQPQLIKLLQRFQPPLMHQH